MSSRIAVAAVALAVAFTPAISLAAPRTPEEKQIDEAIVRALKYLAAEQEPSGAWSINQWRRGRRNMESTAMTSLAIMAFLAAGHVPGEGPYGKQLEKAVDWILDQQVAISRGKGRETVAIVTLRGGDSGMYSHGISTLMLSEVIGMLKGDRRKRCREALEKAIRLILQAQDVRKADTHAGGWRYKHTSFDSDLSVTGWQLLALRAAKDIGCDVPRENIDRAVAYVKKCQVRNDGGFTYQPGQTSTATRTGTGILCLEVCGEHKSREIMTAASYLAARPLRSYDRWFFYGVYYCTVGMFKVGGKHWEATKKNTLKLLLPMQNGNGSWSSRGRIRSRTGPIYATSMAVLALSVEYRYLPIYQR